MKLSVIIPARDAAATIGEQLDSLASQAWAQPWEVIVADNGSRDATAAIAAQYTGRLPALRIVDASRQRGAAHARNCGASAAQGDALAFCDADDVVGQGWLPAMGEALRRHQLVASCFEARRLNSPWVFASRRDLQTRGVRRYTYPPFLPHAGGGGLGVQRRLFLAVRGFDEALPQLEDTDFCWRAQLAGAQLHFAADAVYHVRYRDTFGSLARQSLDYAEHNVLLYKRFQPFGMPRLTWQQSGRAWLALGRRLLRVRTWSHLSAATWELAWRLGRVWGSLRYGVWGV
ncbi:MAG: glycosyltransferase family 2 protein [Anaerolineales bacterium]|nr:glycosyltransferase family 2 protein [Anaerolineales bacterium]